MVFESDLQTVKDDVNTNQFLKGNVDLESLRTKIEAHYAALNPAQKRRWEETRLELLHCLEHLQECVNDRGVTEQKPKVQQILNRITVI